MTAKRRRSLLVAVLVMLAIVACAIAVGFYWGTGPSLRCLNPAQGVAQSGWSARTVVSGGQERCYHLYVPSGYDPAQPAPLVLSFHGFLSNPESHALITGWHELAEREGALVAYPEGSSFPQRWNAGTTWGALDVNDVQFFRDLTEDISDVAAVDGSRIYVNGFSNGGGMTVHIGCEAAGSVAAIGTVAAAVVNMEACAPSRPVPAITFHGTADSIVNYEGGEMSGLLLPWGARLTWAPTYFVGAEEWVATWAKGNGCDPTPETIPPQGDVRGVRYTQCDQGADVILYTIEDGGHTWPGGWPIPVVGKTSTDIDATEEMWRFFQTYSLNDNP